MHLFLQVKWGPVYTLFSDYNVVILYDGTFVEVKYFNITITNINVLLITYFLKSGEQ